MCKDSSDLGNSDLGTYELVFNLLLGIESSCWLRKSFRVFIFQVIKQWSPWIFLHVHKTCSIKVSMKLSKILLLKSTHRGAIRVHSSHERQTNFFSQCLPACISANVMWKDFNKHKKSPLDFQVSRSSKNYWINYTCSHTWNLWQCKGILFLFMYDMKFFKLKHI